MIRSDLHTTLGQLIEQCHGLDELVKEIGRIVNHAYYKECKAFNDEEYSRYLEWMACRRFYKSLQKQLDKVRLPAR